MVEDFRTYKRNLPHWEQPGDIYFVTFRTETGKTLSDTGKDIIIAGIKFHAATMYQLFACVIMDTHVHVIFQPLEYSDGRFHTLARILHSIKSYSANRIQRTLGVQGSIWQNESYDRIIRNDNDLKEKLNYIIFNPVKAGLVERAEDYKWLYCEGFS